MAFFDPKWLYSEGARIPTWFATSRRVIWDSPFARASAQAASRISSRVASRRSACRSRIGVPNMIRIILLGPTPVKSTSALLALTPPASPLALGAWLVKRQARTWRDRGLAELMTGLKEMFG